MSKVVVFTTNNARIVKHPDHLSLGIYRGVAVKDPDLSQVRGLSPEKWKLVKGKVVPKNMADMALTRRSHELNGVDNLIHHGTSFSVRWDKRLWAVAILIGAVAVVLIAGRFFHGQ